MLSRSEACGPETPGISDTAVPGAVAQAGEGVQSGWVKSSICPRVVLESGSPSGSVTLLVTMTAYSVFSSSGGRATGSAGGGHVSAGWMPMTVDDAARAEVALGVHRERRAGRWTGRR